ncbi:MAG TPA: aldehyde dehydrogenase family protein, partial [Ilumatobacteraceae bacterium]
MTLPNSAELTALADAALQACGAPRLTTSGRHRGRTPITGTTLGGVAETAPVDEVVDRAGAAFQTWRTTPGPLRGELVRQFATLLRTHKADLARLVQLEVGKIESEALGEVQEMIDICDFAVGLSRQLYGQTMP